MEKYAMVGIYAHYHNILLRVSNGSKLTENRWVAAGTIGYNRIYARQYLTLRVSGNIILLSIIRYSCYPRVGISVFIAAFCRRLGGVFMVQRLSSQTVFMEILRSLTLGGIIAVIAIIIRKELLIPVLVFGIFFAESISVMLQVGILKLYQEEIWGR